MTGRYRLDCQRNECWIVDTHAASDDADVGYINDPDLAQKIVDLLNEEEDVKELVRMHGFDDVKKEGTP